MNNKKPYKIDVAVLLIFFNRPSCFTKVFEQVKVARPSKLFLYQDGARKNNKKDKIGIDKCRKIALEIDWDCEVHTYFQEKNMGCDPSEYIAQKWAFSHVEKCIILEDDDVPTQSFFPFCKELLDRYEKDERINMICGMNNLEKVDSPYSYLFTETGSIWGWASWRRVIDTWEENYDLLDNLYCREKIKNYLKIQNGNPKGRLKTWEINKRSGVEHYETILGMGQYANHRLNIVPTKNMIINVGNTIEGGTHSVNSLEMIPKGLRRIFTMKSYELEFPLKHPPYIINDVQFQEELFRIMGVGHPFIQIYRDFEKSILLVRHEGIKALFNKIKRRYKK